ncbi:MAG TPA: Holliday junction resolvase RuvX [Planctomycetota bacterium]|nr:Holliday junction resolvase RuvX [Planctomycetota bacterium]
MEEGALKGPVLAVDYGDRRTGLALSDPLGVIAQPLPTLVEGDPAQLARRIADVARERGAATILLGLPLREDGSEGARVERTRAFGRLLAQAVEGTPARIVEWDERFTTAEAVAVLREAGLKRRDRKRRVDAVAAVVLLRSFLAAEIRGGSRAGGARETLGSGPPVSPPP